jgi:hypothetical protein
MGRKREQTVALRLGLQVDKSSVRLLSVCTTRRDLSLGNVFVGLFWATQLLGAFASCPNYCNGRGTCGTGNTCTCDSGYFGGDCSLSEWCHLRKSQASSHWQLPACQCRLHAPPPCPDNQVVLCAPPIPPPPPPISIPPHPHLLRHSCIRDVPHRHAVVCQGRHNSPHRVCGGVRWPGRV